MPIPAAIHGRRATPSRRQPPTPKQGDTAAETPVLAKSLLRRIVGVGEDQDKAGHRLECRRRCPADGARPKDNGVFATPDSPPSHEESL